MVGLTFLTHYSLRIDSLDTQVTEELSDDCLGSQWVRVSAF
jgi:hypothetical protein